MQVRRETAGHAEADNPRATAHHRPRFQDRRREPGSQVAAVAATYDVNPWPSGDARFKSQSNDDNHVVPIRGNPNIACERYRQLRPRGCRMTIVSNRLYERSNQSPAI